MGLFGTLFTWWNGATIGTLVNSALTGKEVGTDHLGNRYFRGKRLRPDGRERRWVIYKGANDASRVPSEWHGWLHGSYDGVPESHLPPPQVWEAEYTPNATGTAQAYRALHTTKGGNQAYEAWTPES